MRLQQWDLASGETPSSSRFPGFSLHPGWVVAVLVLVAARAVFITVAPPGFYVDEAAGAAHAIALLHHGHDAWGTPHPLYSPSLGGGFSTAFYLYPLAAWMAAFGTSEVAIRAFSLASTFVAIAILGVGIRRWFGRREAWLSAATALALPWNWIQGNMAWDPALVPLVVASGFWAFSRIVVPPVSNCGRRASLVLFPVLLLLLAYLYPPMRVTAPLLFLGAYVVFWHQKRIGIGELVATVLFCSALAVPLLQFMLQPEALVRARLLSVFHGASLAEGSRAFGANMLRLLAPTTLFLTGDPNLRHGTGFQGLLGLASLPPLLGLAAAAIRTFIGRRSKPQRHAVRMGFLLVVACTGWLASLAGAALTNEGQPHSLRSCAAWPFATIVLVVGWRCLLEAPLPRHVRRLAIAFFAIGTAGYAVHAARTYPTQAMEAFDTSARRQILSGQPTSDYSALARRYYETR
ncbi:hypothetical protein [Xylophilus sp. Leaf220]|uniref:hypothetical protein n=1 Tax=Xylophilus sp. Leaf220 TaxID=1735686 RepID=UPI0012E26A09|nr:hypothetical protein [Xylophilus sp. Leaf220]